MARVQVFPVFFGHILPVYIIIDCWGYHPEVVEPHGYGTKLLAAL